MSYLGLTCGLHSSTCQLKLSRISLLKLKSIELLPSEGAYVELRKWRSVTLPIYESA